MKKKMQTTIEELERPVKRVVAATYQSFLHMILYISALTIIFLGVYLTLKEKEKARVNDLIEFN